MTKVTDEELVIAGVREWERCKGRSLAESLLRCHSAMCALEPKPTIDELLNSEDTRAIQIMPDGSIRELDREEIRNIADARKSNPLEGANGRMFNDPALAEMDRRIAALERAIARP